jgi:hypothetical protein
MTFNVPNKIIINKADFLYNGIHLKVTPNEIQAGNLTIVSQSITNCPFGFCLGVFPLNVFCGIRVAQINRYTFLKNE